MIRLEDPALMSASARQAEIASILASGARRLSLPSANPLDDQSPVERPCDQPVDAGRDKTVANKEVA